MKRYDNKAPRLFYQPLPPKPTPIGLGPAKSIFLSGGIGDVITLESYFSAEQRRILTTIFYATPQHQAIQELFKALPYPNLFNHQIVWSDFSKFWCFCSKQDCIEKLRPYVGQPGLLSAEDWSIDARFPFIDTTN